MGIRMMSRALASIGVDITRARARQRSLWLDQALPGTLPAAPLDEATTADVCIVGGGISAAMLAQKLTELRPGLSITVVEAGRKFLDLENRMKYRQRSIDYAENPWPGDFIEDQNLTSPIDTSIQSDLRDATTQALASLSPREERIVRMRFGIGLSADHTLAEVGEQFSVSRERIRQIEAKALRKLKHPQRSKILRSFIDD